MKKVILGFENYTITDDCVIARRKSDRPLKHHKNNCGYLKVWLYSGKVRYEKFVHKLMLENFIEKPDPSYLQGNHKNGIKDDNRLINLEWCNNSQNQKHAYAIGLNTGRKKASKIDKIQSITIKKCYDDGLSVRHISKYFGVSIQTAYSHVQPILGREIHT